MNFEQAIEHVLSSEGGFTMDADDPGNWTGGKKGKGILHGTKFGISAASYPGLNIKNLSRPEAIQIYKRDFWDKYKVDTLPSQIRLHFFDVCVNSGISRAVKILQRSLGVTADGDFGPVTVKNLSKANVWKYARERSDFYINHVKLYPVKQKYLAGWIGRVLDVTENSF
ncbi:glycoside hydrolase family 108 protein [Dyadobacter psychrotolerans]|uniref:Secretion activator protein n=1 Tax=Dyadobacter psychrotolerans TaxID=2541721 RepID=A0A4R5DJQ1_9BACT|nr:glycosyl hydrolase 108 family protein [Dyadobacter psychrotolerans]TDE10813.1 secretion activator protein [Dyadobacter psychrotolerans]